MLSGLPRRFLPALVATAVLAAVPAFAQGKAPPGWEEIEKLASDQKLAEALQGAEARLAAARGTANTAEWTRALIKVVQLQIGLRGYETSVRFLKEQPWPEAPVARSAVGLFYAQTLVSYASAYSWEIRQRERVASQGPVDLKAWTMDQIAAEAHRAYLDAWKHREALGREPLSTWAEYLVPNSYPKGIRDTLRDAVTYLWAQLCTDSSLWRPEQSNELFRLDARALARGNPAASARVKLEDPEVHPLVRLGAVLDDLEAWHLAQGNRDAALEARLERTRWLHNAFTQPEDRQAIRDELEASLPAFAQVPWFAMGKAVLAELTNDGGDLFRAHAQALEGARAYPQSLGAKRCLAVAGTIEAPDIQLAGMETDGLERRTLLVTHRNLPSVSLRAYRLDPDALVAAWKDYNLLPSGNALNQLVQGQKPEVEWTVALPPTPDFQSHKTFIVPPMTRKGLYVIAASAVPGFPMKRNRIEAVVVNFSDLVLLVRQGEGTAEARVLRGDTGAPVPDASVDIYRFDWRTGHSKAGTRRTDAQGWTRLDAALSPQSGGYFLIARLGDQQAIDPQQLGYFERPRPSERKAALIYTDRSIYRPLQKVLWKVVAFSGGGESPGYRVTPETSVKVTLFDGNGQKVEQKSVRTNGFGSAAGEFTIPAGRLLGAWQLATEPEGRASIRVEEYKRPTFEASFKTPEAALRLNTPATLVGEARYYFGLPVTSGQVRWRVTREPVWPWWWDFSPSVQTQVIATGTSPLADDGTFRVAFTPEADARTRSDKDVSYRYRVVADVTDEGGETRSADRGFRLGWVAVEGHIHRDAGFFLAGQGGELAVLRTDLDGTPRPGQGSYRVVALRGPDAPLLPGDEPVPPAPELAQPRSGPKVVTPGDRLRPRWSADYDPMGRYEPERAMRRWAAGEQKAAGALTHDEKGQATVKLPPLPAGAYRLEYETVDPFGAKAIVREEFLVGGDQMQVPLPLALALASTTAHAGETARLLVVSGLPEQRLLLEIQRQKGTERRVLVAGASPTVIELPLTEADRGGVLLTVTTVRDYQVMTFTQSLFVPFDDKELRLGFSTFRDKIRPGAKETFRVTVKGPPGARLEAGAVELLAYMYDRALDAFAPHAPPSVASLYPQRLRSGSLRATVGMAQSQWITSDEFPKVPEDVALQPDTLKFYDSYGVGGPGGRGGRRLYKNGTLALESRAAPVGRMQQPMADGAPPQPPPSPQPATTPALAQSVASPSGAGQPAPAPAPQLRQDFSETAFWQPRLLTDAAGQVAIEFTVPDSVTSWNVWAHGLTRELSGGSVTAQTRSVKELMVRPYVPRFLREGDEAQLQVVINNASDRELKGELSFGINDAESQASLLDAFSVSGEDRKPRPFTVAAGKSARLSYAIKAPSRTGQVAFKVVATAGSLSDGELRPLPVLPSRVHLAQSRFVTLHGNDKRTLRFEDLARADDPTRVNEQLVVTVDAQLFYSVLEALPYLANFPYECTEQTLNRFVSTGIVSRLYKDYPGVAKMAAGMSKRQTPLETWDAADPNRKMALEETPWLAAARGGKAPEAGLVNVLDPRVADAERVSSLSKLRKSQTAIGGFPWWPGGPPSPYMTLYLAHGLARAAEYGVDIPKDVTQRAWGYLAKHYREQYADNLAQGKAANWEFLTFLNYVASAYPDASFTGDALSSDERKRILDYTFSHWKEHSPYLKGYLALTLNRMGRREDALRVWDSVMDSAKTTQDEGTFWMPEERAWLWYNDTIETHAFALRTLMELRPRDSRREGLVQWLLLHKKLGQWKSTRATAEAIYALVKYLEQEHELANREEVRVRVGSRETRMVFEPDQYTGKKNQILLPGPEVDARAASIEVEKPSKGFAFASATWQFSTEKLPAEERGDFFSVSRRYFKREKTGRETVLKPLAEGAVLQPGDEVEVQLSLRTKQAAEYVHLRDPRAAGLEPENAVSRYKWELGIAWYEETRDSGTNFFFDWLPAGEYTFHYRLRANLTGRFRVGPATVQSMYAPEFNAYSAGAVLEVAEPK